LWSTAYQRSVGILKRSFISGLVLHHFDPKRKIVVKINPSSLVIAGVFSQYSDGSILYPMAYFSGKHSPAEINYEIYDKELFTIISTFKGWFPLLDHSPHTIVVISNH
jgi:hypothetical protein